MTNLAALPRRMSCGLAALMLFAGAPALAQAPAANGTLDPGNLSGVWFSADFRAVRAQRAPRAERGTEPTMVRTADGKAPPLTPWANEIVQKRLQDAKDGHPYAHTKSRCLPAGLPKSMDPPAALPIQILMTPGQVTVLFEEFNNFRIIRMNAQHAEDPNPGFFGDSVGHWEGDTLVVDTIALTTQTVIDSAGIPHSEDLHLVERFRRTGPDTMEHLVTMTDPKAFTAPWSIRNAFKSVPGMTIGEYYCENDRNEPDETGQTGVQLPGS
jgi:hypothetical protein